MRAYRIVDWDQRYEVKAKGWPADGYIPMERRRVGPLNFVRSKVFGWQIGPGLDELIGRSWQNGSLFHWACFGIFHKLLEIAASQKRELRGWILDSNGKPCGPEYFAKRFKEVDVNLVKDAFAVLCHPEINWVEFREIPDISRKVGETREPFFNTIQSNTNQSNSQELTTTNELAEKIRRQKEALREG